jgi:1-acyl-sn-glycerol-3-phosphate acyltransferase
MLAMALLTLFMLRRLYSEWLLRPCAHWILRIWGLEMVVHQRSSLPQTQTVFVINHTSTIDMFAIVALGLPNTRFFLSGYLRKILPLAVIGYMTGIFWTVPQEYQQQRVRIFQRAHRVLSRTRESVCLSPEGKRVISGEIGPFNKGAFHLAAALNAPMQPIYIQIPNEINPGRSMVVRPGIVHIHIGEPFDTSEWRDEDAGAIKEEVRDFYVRWKEELDA